MVGERAVGLPGLQASGPKALLAPLSPAGRGAADRMTAVSIARMQTEPRTGEPVGPNPHTSAVNTSFIRKTFGYFLHLKS